MTARPGRERAAAEVAETPPERRDDDPSDWGWHHEWGRGARISGWLSAAVLLIMITSVDYGFSGATWLICIAASIIAILLWDAHRRRNSWKR